MRETVDAVASEAARDVTRRRKTDSASLNAACCKAAHNTVARTRASGALSVVSARVAAGAVTGITIPAVVTDTLRDVSAVAAPPETVDKVVDWLLANPWELKKCRTLAAALNAVSQCCRPGSEDKEVRAVADQAEALLARGPAFTELKEVVNVPSMGCEVLCRGGGQGLKLAREHVEQALRKGSPQVVVDKCSLKLKQVGGDGGATLTAQVRVPQQPSLTDAEPSAQLQVAMRDALQQAKVTCGFLALPAELVRYVIGRGGRSIKSVEAAIVSRLNAACASADAIVGCHIVTVQGASSLRVAAFAPAVAPAVRLAIIQAELQTAAERARGVSSAAKCYKAHGDAASQIAALHQIAASELDGSACKERRERKRFLDSNRKRRARERCAKGGRGARKGCDGQPWGGQLGRGPAAEPAAARRARAASARFNRQMGWTFMEDADGHGASSYKVKHTPSHSANTGAQTKLVQIKQKRVTTGGRDLCRWRAFSLSCDGDEF